jgi:prophage regulatory protein
MSLLHQGVPDVTERNQEPISILRRRDLESRLRLSRSTIYDKINPNSPRYDETFPKQIKLGGAAVGWIAHEVDQWLVRQVEASRKLGG